MLLLSHRGKTTDKKGYSWAGTGRNKKQKCLDNRSANGEVKGLVRRRVGMCVLNEKIVGRWCQKEFRATRKGQFGHVLRFKGVCHGGVR